MSKALSVDKLLVGDTVTMLSGSPDGFIGAVLVVRVIDLPFVLVTREDSFSVLRDDKKKHLHTVDTRKCTFGKISQEFADAAMQGYIVEQDDSE